MKLDADTHVAGLLAAIPSSARVFHRFHIPLDGNEYKTLAEICRDNGIDLQEFLRAIDDIDWEGEDL